MNIDDPLDDLSSLSQLMEQLAVIGRCRYMDTAQTLITVF